MKDVVFSLGGGVLALAGFLLPGLGWAFAFRWPAPWFAGGVLSALVIFTGVVGSAVLGIPVMGLTQGIWLGGIALGGAWFWKQRRIAQNSASAPLGDWWLALPGVPMLLVALWRASLQPLSGADNVFRWDHLARLIVQTGNLDYYPPHTAEGFSLYFWADGIAPLISSQYAWTYLATGSTDIRWTVIPVLLQYAGLLVLLLGLGRWWGGPRGGWFAIALAGGTLLLQFAFGLGQETGCTALGAIGMLFYLLHWQRDRIPTLLVPAAACAALVACSREYGFTFLLIGAGSLGILSRNWKLTAAWTAGAGLLPFAWHLRNWLLTGNPFYAMNVAGLFPLNPVFNAWMQDYVRIFGKTLLEFSGWREIARLLLLSTMPALAGFCAGAWLWRRRSGWLAGVLTGALSATLCLISAPYTAGGFFYAMRVMSPLMLLGCAWGGGVLAHWFPGRTHLTGVLAGLTLLGIDASLRAWTIPVNPYTLAPQEWPEAGYRLQLDFLREDQTFLESVAQTVPGKVLSDSAGVQDIFRARGRQLTPFWSPETAFLFAPNFKGDAVARLRELGYTHLLLKRAQFTVDFLTREGALARLEGRISFAKANSSYVLFALEPPAPASAR
jgi:hypothetical protein